MRTSLSFLLFAVLIVFSTGEEIKEENATSPLKGEREDSSAQTQGIGSTISNLLGYGNQNNLDFGKQEGEGVQMPQPVPYGNGMNDQFGGLPGAENNQGLIPLRGNNPLENLNSGLPTNGQQSPNPLQNQNGGLPMTNNNGIGSQLPNPLGNWNNQNSGLPTTTNGQQSPNPLQNQNGGLPMTNNNGIGSQLPNPIGNWNNQNSGFPAMNQNQNDLGSQSPNPFNDGNNGLQNGMSPMTVGNGMNPMTTNGMNPNTMLNNGVSPNPMGNSGMLNNGVNPIPMGNNGQLGNGMYNQNNQGGRNPQGNYVQGMQGSNGMQNSGFGLQSMPQRLFQNAMQWFQDFNQRFQQIRQQIPGQTYDRMAENRRMQATNIANMIANYNNQAQQYMRNENQGQGFMRWQESRLTNLGRTAMPLTVKVFRCGVNMNTLDCASA